MTTPHTEATARPIIVRKKYAYMLAAKCHGVDQPQYHEQVQAIVDSNYSTEVIRLAALGYEVAP
jgi:hypothetical protein